MVFIDPHDRTHAPLIGPADGAATIFRTREHLKPGAFVGLHTHRGDESFEVREGRVLFTVGAEQRACEPGAIVFVPAGVRHGFVAETAAVLDVFSEQRTGVYVIVLAPDGTERKEEIFIAGFPSSHEPPPGQEHTPRERIRALYATTRHLLARPPAVTAAHFDLQPVLEGELIRLRPLRPDDFEALFAVASDPLIWEQHPANDRHEEAVFRAFFREALESGGALVAIDRADGRIIGSSRYFDHNPDASEIEIGWTFLARSHWGGRYNGEMKRLMLQHAFQFVDRVVFLVGPRNLRSQRAVERIGGVRAGSRIDAAGRESVVFAITAERFRQGTPD